MDQSLVHVNLGYFKAVGVIGGSGKIGGAMKVADGFEPGAVTGPPP